MFAAQAALLAAAQIILLVGVLGYPGHGTQQPLANAFAAISYAGTGFGFWLLVGTIPAGLISRLRRAFLLFCAADICTTWLWLGFPGPPSTRAYQQRTT